MKICKRCGKELNPDADGNEEYCFECCRAIEKGFSALVRFAGDDREWLHEIVDKYLDEYLENGRLPR